MGHVELPSQISDQARLFRAHLGLSFGDLLANLVEGVLPPGPAPHWAGFLLSGMRRPAVGLDLVFRRNAFEPFPISGKGRELGHPFRMMLKASVLGGWSMAPIPLRDGVVPSSRD